MLNTTILLVGWHRHIINRFGYQIQPSQTLRPTSPVLLSHSRHSPAPPELRYVPSDVVWEFSCVPDSTCSYGGTSKILQYITYRIVTFCSSQDLCTGPLETLCAAETLAHSTTGDFYDGVVFPTRWFFVLHSHKPLCLSYSSMLQSLDDWHHHNMECIIYLNLSICIQTVRLAADGIRELNWSSTWRCWSNNPIDAPGGLVWVSFEMHWDGGGNRVNQKMQMEAKVKWTSEMHLETFTMWS